MEKLKKKYPLTLPQQDIYYEQLFYPKSPIYNIGAKVKIEGSVNVIPFKEAYNMLINQHDTYRAILELKEDTPFLKILEKHNSVLEFIDYSTENDAKEKAESFMQKRFKQSFNLYNELLHKFILIKVTDQSYYLFSVYHHIITDGWGTSLMFQRLVKNYNELLEFGKTQSKYPFSYVSFINDDIAYKNSDSFIKDKEYWVEKFKTLPEALIPLIKEKQNKNKREEFYIKRETYNNLNTLSKKLKVSTFHIILGILYTYFGRYYNNNDFAIGLPVLNRGKSIFKKTVGLFMGVSALRICIDFDDSFQNLVSQIRSQLRQDYRHQRFPFGKLIKELNLYGEKDRVFNISLSYEKQNYATNFNETKTTVIPLSNESERVALAVYIREFDENEDVKIDFDYNISYFDKSRISQIVKHFQVLLSQILKDSSKKLKEFKLYSKEEEKRILFDFNKTEVTYPVDKTIVYLFKKQLKFNPERTITDGKTTYSYRELDVLSNKIAQYINSSLNLSKHKPIAVLLKRSSNLLAILLGILKSGHSFIPLDPTFPIERLEYILNHSQCEHLITEKKLAKTFKAKKIPTTSVKTLLNLEEIESYEVNINEFDTAYIIYTSGSTGNPKGVEICHQSLLNFLLSMKDLINITINDTLYAVTTYSFDISLLELFLPLISGANIFIETDKILSDPFKIVKQINRVKPTIIQATPSFYQMLFNAKWKGHKKLKILCGGDLLTESLAEKLISISSYVWNMYGPTETTIWSSTKRIRKSKDSRSIGKPIQNTTFYILDSWMNPLPIGAIGDIYIGGDGLAKGYYNDDILTRERFLTNPFLPNMRIYKTGDIGKWNISGEIQFLGRNDNQVKIRGYRIELAEIEKKISELNGINETVVIQKNESFLVAYVIADNKINTELIIHSLELVLPNYMIPKVIIQLKEFPLTPNNKIDRKQLISKDIEDINHYNLNIRQNPKNETEEKILIIWKKILTIKQCGVYDNFFGLGGHSLNAVKLISEVNEEFECNLTLKDLFDNPTVVSLATLSKNNIKDESEIIRLPKAVTKEYYDVTYPQRNLWLFSQRKEASLAYNMNAAFMLKGNLKNDLLNKSVISIIKKHEILRTNFIEIDGIPKQIIRPFKKDSFEIKTFYSVENIDDVVDSFTYKTFDLENDNLIRLCTIQTEDKQTILVFSAHHIIMDGWSLEVFIKELVCNYNILSKKQKIEELELEYQFKDYSEMLQNVKTGEENKTFWNTKLTNYQSKSSFKRDFKNQQQSYKGDIISFKFSQEQTLQFKKISQLENKTVFSVLVAIINVLIYKYSNHNDICVGIVSSGRNYLSLQNQMGLYANTLPIRTKVKPEINFIEVLNSVSKTISESFLFEQIEGIHLDQLIDVLIVYQDPDFSFKEINNLNGLDVTPYVLNHKTSRFPITFDFYDDSNLLKCNLEYNTDFYQKETILLIIEKLKKLTLEALYKPQKKIDDYSITLEIEQTLHYNINFNF